MYLEDEISRETYFANDRGRFNIGSMRDKGSFTVSGVSSSPHGLQADLVTTGPGSSPGIGFGSWTRPGVQYSGQQPWMGSAGQRQGPSSSFQMMSSRNQAFIPPQKKQKTVRKQILVADTDSSGHLKVYSMCCLGEPCFSPKRIQNV